MVCVLNNKMQEEVSISILKKCPLSFYFSYDTKQIPTRYHIDKKGDHLCVV
jgi:hypothetical protein